MENHAPITLVPAWDWTRSTFPCVSVIEWPHMRADDIATRPQTLYTGILTDMAMIIPVGEKVGEASATTGCRPVYGIETWRGGAAGSVVNPLEGGFFSKGVGSLI